MTKRFWLATGIVLLVACPAIAETPSGTLRVFASSASPTGEWSGDIFAIPTTIEADSTFGLGVFYEVRVNDRLGVDSGIYFADFDFELRAAGGSADFGSATAIPLIFGANFHPHVGERVDFYIGPLLSYTLWGNLDTPAGTASVDGDFGVGGVVGVDLSLGESGWILNAGLRYLTTSVSDPSADIDVDPLFAELGFGYQF